MLLAPKVATLFGRKCFSEFLGSCCAHMGGHMNPILHMCNLGLHAYIHKQVQGYQCIYKQMAWLQSWVQVKKCPKYPVRQVNGWPCRKLKHFLKFAPVVHMYYIYLHTQFQLWHPTPTWWGQALKKCLFCSCMWSFLLFCIFTGSYFLKAISNKAVN